MIYHIYWGTSGNAGLYLDEIYQVLKLRGFKQRCFVNYYYPFDYGDKLFFRFGDIGHSKLGARTRKITQLIELLFGFVYILFCCAKDKPKIINYSHVANSYLFIRIFVRLAKALSGAKLIITCHDVNCHMASGELEKRKTIFKIADFLLVHTQQSKIELQQLFGIESAKILTHPFPIMDLNKLKPNYQAVYNKCDFLFIGHLRKDKGIQLLLDAWPEFHKLCPNATLRVCGKTAPGVTIDYQLLEGTNAELNIRFIPDDEYYEYVKAARYVVLPYIEGTNSGIISTVLSLGASVITSDLPMFTENPLVDKSFIFRSSDKESLINALRSAMNSQTKENTSILSKYKEDFSLSVNRLYASIS